MWPYRHKNTPVGFFLLFLFIFFLNTSTNMKAVKMQQKVIPAETKFCGKSNLLLLWLPLLETPEFYLKVLPCFRGIKKTNSVIFSPIYPTQLITHVMF